MTSLDLADNSIQAEGAKAIAQMLTANNAIVDLVGFIFNIVRSLYH